MTSPRKSPWQVQTADLEWLLASVSGRAPKLARLDFQSSLREAAGPSATDRSDRFTTHIAAASFLVRDQPDRCLALLERMETLADDDAVAHRLAGYAWLVKRRQDAMADGRTLAAKHFDQAIRLNPHQTDCWLWLGRLSEDAGDDDRALKHYQRAAILDDSDDSAAIAASQIHARRRDLREAIHTLRVCLLRNQRSPELNVALAKFLRQRAAGLAIHGQRRGYRRFLTEALECYRVANAASPVSGTLVDQGLLQIRLGHHAAAMESFGRAVAHDGTSTVALNHLANAHLENGNIDQAITHFKLALATDPGHAHTHFRYTRAQKFRSGPATQLYLDELANHLAVTDLPRHGRIHLEFAMAKVLDDIGRHDDAWQHFDRANRLKSRQRQSKDSLPDSTTQKQTEFQKSNDASVAFFDRAYFESLRGRGNPSPVPVFIVGMPRSGTTLTEQILSSHPEIAGAGELATIDQIRQEILIRERARSKRDQTTPRSYVSLIGGLTDSTIAEHAEHYLDQLRELGKHHRHVTDKMPTNFLHLGLIATLFPHATIIHCRRHPMDVLVSCYCQNLNAPFCDLEQLIPYHRNYRRLMRHWNQVLPMPIQTVDYESLVVDPETESRKLINHCGLDWDAKCLDFHQSRRSVHTPSKWQVRQPIYATSLQKWRRFERQLAPIAAAIADEIREEDAEENRIQSTNDRDRSYQAPNP